MSKRLTKFSEGCQTSRLSRLKYIICLTHILKIIFHLMLSSILHYSKNIRMEVNLTNSDFILIARLNSGMEIKTINNLVQRLDLLYFDDAEKAILYIELLFEALNELDPDVKVLFFYEI